MKHTGALPSGEAAISWFTELRSAEDSSEWIKLELKHQYVEISACFSLSWLGRWLTYVIGIEYSRIRPREELLLCGKIFRCRSRRANSKPQFSLFTFLAVALVLRYALPRAASFCCCCFVSFQWLQRRQNFLRYWKGKCVVGRVKNKKSQSEREREKKYSYKRAEKEGEKRRREGEQSKYSRLLLFFDSFRSFG